MVARTTFASYGTLHLRERVGEGTPYMSETRSHSRSWCRNLRNKRLKSINSIGFHVCFDRKRVRTKIWCLDPFIFHPDFAGCSKNSQNGYQVASSKPQARGESARAHSFQTGFQVTELSRAPHTEQEYPYPLGRRLH